MKVRNLYRFSRLWLALLAIAFGALAGSIVGRQSVEHATQTRLGEYAGLLLQREIDLQDEIHSTFRQVKSSSNEPCSDQDIQLLRRLNFASRFVKDIGRVNEGNLLCSATMGKLVVPAPSSQTGVDNLPASSFGTGISGSASNLLGTEKTRAVVSDGVQVIVSPGVFSDFGHRTIQYEVGTSSPASVERLGTPSKLLSWDQKQVTFPAGLLQTKRIVKVGETLFNARCDPATNACAVTSISLPTVWAANHGLLSGYTATGTVAGLLYAVVLLLADRRGRSQTNQLRRAILMGELTVAYQPIVELGTQRIIGAEALARWTDEQGDSIRPETILALAEAEGFVSEITRFVVTRALDEMAEVLENRPDFRLSINLAPSDLADPRLLLLLDEKLRDGRMTPANLAFELPERATTDREVAVAAIRRLRQRGHAVFIDDFGTGYSNLAYLDELNVDGIKINRSFIATIGTESITASIVPQILEVAKALGLQVVVQGIEREEQARYFATGNPMIVGQGWFFGLPIPARSLNYLCAERSE